MSASKNIKTIMEKHIYSSFLFNKVADLQSTTLLKKNVERRCFLVNFAKVVTLFRMGGAKSDLLPVFPQ